VPLSPQSHSSSPEPTSKLTASRTFRPDGQVFDKPRTSKNDPGPVVPGLGHLDPLAHVLDEIEQWLALLAHQ